MPSTVRTHQLQILPVLRRIQSKYGYLNREELKRFSKQSGVPLHRLHEVASFFPHSRSSPPPPVTVKVCRDMACHLAGWTGLCQGLQSVASAGVHVEAASCLGRCDRAPVVSVSVGQEHERSIAAVALKS